jgi:hypothetical protein
MIRYCKLTFNHSSSLYDIIESIQGSSEALKSTLSPKSKMSAFRQFFSRDRLVGDGNSGSQSSGHIEYLIRVQHNEMQWHVWRR